MQIGWIAALSMVLSGCTEKVEAQGDVTQTSGMKIASSVNSTSEATGVDGKGQQWSISLTGEHKRMDLPATTMMRLLGGDLTALIKRECGPSWRMETCDVYVQPDSTGALTGYLFISGSADDGFGFNTDTMISGGRECSLGGSFENLDGDPRADFSARAPFATAVDGVESIGMIYLERVEGRLRVSDERWNYCYDDRHIDDIYVLVGTLKRELDKSKWGA